MSETGDPAGAEQADLSELRASLDEVDKGIVSLIAQRGRIISDIAGVKQQGSGAIQDTDRERRVLAAVEATARDLGVSASLVRTIFRELIGDSVAQQARQLATGDGARLRVAFQGSTNAYSDAAARKYLASRGAQGELTGYETFSEAVDALAAGAADLAVLPIENTTAGSINEVYALLRERDLFIVGEETWKVDHCLAALQEVPLQSLSKILSHPQGLEQCSQFLRSLPNATPTSYFDTAGAMAAVAAGNDLSAAAIGSAEAAEAHGLVILRQGINDSADNYTRFVVLSLAATPVDARIACKTSLIMVTRHEEGALLRCLQILAGSGHSLTKLESRPRPGRPWEYLFFVDIEGNVSEPRTAAALEELRAAVQYIKVLGSYPAKALRHSAYPGSLDDAPAEGSPAEELEAVAARPAPAAGRSRQYRLVDRAARTEDTVIQVGDVLVGGDGFVVMAGPCAVESKEQIFATAKFVRDQGAHVLRGGVFKPRTSPYSFQGLGWDGLDLLVGAGRETGLPIVTEVMAVNRSRRSPAYADVLQIGARNMQNYDLLRRWAGWTSPCCSSAACPARSRSGWRRPSTLWPRATNRSSSASAGSGRSRAPPATPWTCPRSPSSTSARTCRSSSTPVTAPGCAATSRRWPGRPAPPGPTACWSRSTRRPTRPCPTPTRASRSASSPGSCPSSPPCPAGPGPRPPAGRAASNPSP